MIFKKYFSLFFRQKEYINEQPKERIKTIKEFELEEFLGKPVICLSNEIQNLTVGIAKEIIFLSKAKNPFLVVQDVISNTEIIPAGIIFAYTQQKFEAVK